MPTASNPVDFEVLPEQRLITMRCPDPISAAALKDLLARRDAHPHFRREFRRLVDARGVRTLPQGPPMYEVAELLVRENSARAAIAFVVQCSAVACGIFRLLDIVGELNGCSRRVCPTVEAAIHWLEGGAAPCGASARGALGGRSFLSGGELPPTRVAPRDQAPVLNGVCFETLEPEWIETVRFRGGLRRANGDAGP